jgi:hypothetical protein
MDTVIAELSQHAKLLQMFRHQCLPLMPDRLETKIVKNPADSLYSSLVITRSSNNGSKIHERHHSVSPAVNGTISSRDKLSTSMQCSHHCTIFPLLKRTLDAWEQLKSPLAKQSLPKGSKRVANGPAPGMPQSKQPNSLSLTGKTNSENTGSTSKVISLPKSPLLTTESSFMTLQSEMRSGVGRTPYSLTHIDSPSSTPPSLCLMESNLITPEHLQSGQAVKQARPKYATDSTLSMDAETQWTIAVSNTLAKNVNASVTEKNNVIAKRELAHELCPKYLRYNLWEGGSHFLPSSADWTEAASPLPPVPTSELANPIVTKTIKENPHLFDIAPQFLLIVSKIYLNPTQTNPSSNPYAEASERVSGLGPIPTLGNILIHLISPCLNPLTNGKHNSYRINETMRSSKDASPNHLGLSFFRECTVCPSSQYPRYEIHQTYEW